MSHSENADYEIVEKSFLHHSIKKFMQSQIIQIIVNLIFDNNVHSIILESILFLLKQQAVVNSLSNKQILILCSHFDNHNDNFLKKIRIKKSADYYSKFLCEHNE